MNLLANFWVFTDNKMTRTRITLMVGIPGCGKSAYLKSMSNPSGGGNPIILSPDEFRKEMTGHAFYAPAEDFVWGCVKTCARILARQFDLVIDATHLGVGSRAQWL